jgi:hypothetical protein
VPLRPTSLSAEFVCQTATPMMSALVVCRQDVLCCLPALLFSVDSDDAVEHGV